MKSYDYMTLPYTITTETQEQLNKYTCTYTAIYIVCALNEIAATRECVARSENVCSYLCFHSRVVRVLVVIKV